MAKVISLFKISGTIGDLTFRQTKDGPVAQMKPGPTRERVLNHERFRNTRLNAAEFKLAIKEGKLLRDALGIAKEGMRVASLNGRMNGLFYKVLESDPENCRGERYASNGDMQLLTGFEFNKDLLLANALPPGITHQLDDARGVLKVELPAFIARKKKGFPKEATHFRIVSGGAAINFTRRSYRNNVKTSELLPLGKKTPGAINFEHTLEAGTGNVLVQVLGIQLYKLVDGREVLLPGGAMRVLEVVKVAEGIEATRQKGNEDAGLPEVEAGDEVVYTKEEPGVVHLEAPLMAVGGIPQTGIAGSERNAVRRKRRGRDGVGLAPRVRGRKRLLICRSSVDLHYICNPSDGTSWQPEVRAVTGAPGNDP